MAGKGAKAGEGVADMPKPLTQIARKLRHDMTDAERKLWSRMRAHQLDAHFRRQAPLGSYVLDFICFAARLVVEVDGGQHADSTNDKLRDAWLQAQGFRVLRFWNNEVLENIDGVLETIMAELNKAPPPQPSPTRGEGAGGADRSSPVKREGAGGADRLSPSPFTGEGWGGGEGQ